MDVKILLLTRDLDLEEQHLEIFPSDKQSHNPRQRDRRQSSPSIQSQRLAPTFRHSEDPPDLPIGSSQGKEAATSTEEENDEGYISLAETWIGDMAAMRTSLVARL